MSKSKLGPSRGQEPSDTRIMRNLSGQKLFFWSVVAVSLLVLGYLAFFYSDGYAKPPATSKLKLDQIPFNGARAYDYLKKICAIGTRGSGSPGMTAQQKMLEEHFTKLGARVVRQEFRARDPQSGNPVSMVNLIVQWHPESKQRILLATHYDTRPFPDRDFINPRGTFLGANDGGSGTAILMELGNEMPQLKLNYGVDFVFLDGEELVYDDRRQDPYFIGSEYFARDYVGNPPPYVYRAAVVLDMVGDADLSILQDRSSVAWPESRPIVDQIWNVAARLGVNDFQPRVMRTEVRDDHLQLRNIGGIPTCEVIDMDYPAWHTTKDLPERCSALSLAKVGWVIEEWLKSLR